MGHIGRHHRRSIRLRGYDYARDGAYFVTICTRGRVHVFGSVVRGEMQLNEHGLAVASCWTWLAERYPYVHLDRWVVMPNHMHGIIITGNGAGFDDAHFDDGRGRGVQNRVNQTRERHPIHPRREIVAT